MLVALLSYMIWIGLVLGGMVLVFRYLDLKNSRRAAVRVRALQERKR